jgi:thioredoxin reductase (NADPH)
MRNWPEIGAQTKARRSFYDSIVIGGGLAGILSRLYMAREGMDTLVIEKAGLGGQAGITQTLDNFPGFDEGIPGAEFAARLGRQARRFGVEIMQAQAVSDIFPDGPYLCITTGDGTEYGTKAALSATGAHYRVGRAGR